MKKSVLFVLMMLLVLSVSAVASAQTVSGSNIVVNNTNFSALNVNAAPFRAIIVDEIQSDTSEPDRVVTPFRPLSDNALAAFLFRGVYVISLNELGGLSGVTCADFALYKVSSQGGALDFIPLYTCDPLTGIVVIDTTQVGNATFVFDFSGVQYQRITPLGEDEVDGDKGGQGFGQVTLLNNQQSSQRTNLLRLTSDVSA